MKTCTLLHSLSCQSIPLSFSNPAMKCTAIQCFCIVFSSHLLGHFNATLNVMFLGPNQEMVQQSSTFSNVTVQCCLNVISERLFFFCFFFKKMEMEWGNCM